MSGVSAQEAESALVQFSQGLAAGVLQGDELKAILENFAPLARELAAGLNEVTGRTDITAGKLRQLGAEGVLESDLLVQALEARRGEIEAQFQLSVKTFEQSTTRLANIVEASLAQGDVGSRFADGAKKLVDALTNASQFVLDNAGNIAATIQEGNRLSSFQLDSLRTTKDVYGDILKRVDNIAGLQGIISQLEKEKANTFLPSQKQKYDEIIETIKDYQKELKETRRVEAAEEESAKAEAKAKKLLTLQEAQTAELKKIKDERDAIDKQVDKIIEKLKKTNPILLTRNDLEKQYRRELEDSLRAIAKRKDDEEKAAKDEKKKQADKLAAERQALHEIEKAIGRRKSVEKTVSAAILAESKKTYEGRIKAVNDAAAAQEATVKATTKLILDSDQKTEEEKREATSRELELIEKIEKARIIAIGNVDAAQKVADQQQDERDQKEAARLQKIAEDTTYEGRLQRIAREAEISGRDIANLFENSFKAAEDALVEFTKTGELNFEGLVDGIIDQLVRLSIQAAIIKPLAGAFGIGAESSASGDGLFTSIAAGLGSLLSGYANGGSFTVGRQNTIGGLPGVDSQVVAFKARPGEQVTVTPPGETGRVATPMINMYIQTPDADSFRKSQGQIYAEAQRQLSAAGRRNN